MKTIPILLLTLNHPVFVTLTIVVILAATIVILVGTTPEPEPVLKNPVDIILRDAQRALKDAKDNPPQNMESVTKLMNQVNKLNGVEKYRCATGEQLIVQRKLQGEYEQFFQEIESMFDYVQA